MNDKMNEETVDEGLLDRIVDTIAGKSSKASQHATNLKAFFRGDKDAIGDPEQAENLRKFERNLHRIKEKFDKLIEELGDDLVSAIGVPDEGPFKDVVDEFDTAVNTLRDAIDNIAVKADKIDDALPSAKPAAKRFSREEYENKKDKKKDTVKSDDQQQDDGDEFNADDYGFDDDGVFRAKPKPEPASELDDVPDEEATESTDDYDWREVHAGWEKDLASSAGLLDTPKSDLADWVGPNGETWVGHLNDAWDEYASEDGRSFYYNVDTNESSWEHPEHMSPVPGSEHEKYWDEAEQGSMPALTESMKQTLSTWQKIIS
jgi:hypothetical protein